MAAFDFDHFSNLLYAAGKAAFFEIQTSHPTEKFYFFALCTNGDLNDIFSLAGSEEGLTRVARQYFEKGYYLGFNLPDQREALRWSEGDSPFLGEARVHFEGLNALISSAREELDAATQDEFDLYSQRFMSTLVAVLQQLDAEGIFGINELRDAITLCVVTFDQSNEDRAMYVEQINPHRVADRYKQQISREWSTFHLSKPDPALALEGTGKLFERAKQLHAEGNFRLARLLFEQVLVIESETAAAQDAGTARVLAALAKTLSSLGEYRDAETLARRALETRNKLFGVIHPETAESLHVLGEILSDLGIPSLGREMTEQAYRVRKQILGQDHVDTLESQKNLALLLSGQGKVEQAEELLTEALIICKTTKIEQSWTYARVLNATALLKAKHPETLSQACQMYEQSLAIHERIHPSHPETALLLNNLAACLADLGDLERAAGLGVQSQRLHEQIYGPNNIHLIPVLLNLGDIYRRQKDYDAALPFYERSLILSEQVFGAQHPLTMRSLKKLVALYGLLQKENSQLMERRSEAFVMALYTCMVALQPAEGSLPSGMKNMSDAHLDSREAEKYLHQLTVQLRKDH